ncbi:MAG: hypothetical protein PW734_00030 [Verrucomicrobium sp.]|nr:hypothetical protein [Verrucomicrobium sp.]
MNSLYFWLPYFAAILGLAYWRQRALATLPDAERLKVLDYQSRLRWMQIIPFGICIVLIVWAPLRVMHRHQHALFIVPSLCFLLACIVSIYFHFRGLSRLEIPKNYLRHQGWISLISVLLIAVTFGFVGWKTLHPF